MRPLKLNLRFNQTMLLMLVICLTLIGLSYWRTMVRSEHDLEINLAGRQRMLSQQIHRLLLQLQSPATTDRLTLFNLRQATTQFDQTLQSFQHGGRAPELRRILDQVQTLWQGYLPLLEHVVTASLASSAQHKVAAQAYAQSHSDQLLQLSEQFTSQLGREHTSELAYVRLVNYASFALVLVLLGLSWHTKREIDRSQQIQSDFLKAQAAAKEKLLTQTRKQLNEIIDISPDIIWVKSLAGVYQSCNLAFAHYLGKEIGEIIGKTDFDLTTPKEAKDFIARDLRTVASRAATCIEELHTPASGGAPRLFEIIKTPVFGAASQITGVQGVGRDITERRAAEQALGAANAQSHLLELCIAQLHEAVVITKVEPFGEPRPRIVFVNDAFERMTGYSRSESLGQSPRRLMQGPNTQSEVLDCMNHGLAGWQPVHAELIYYKKNGDASWTEMDIVQFASDLGWFRVSVHRDISARKAADAELLYICDRAREASSLKSEFLSAISHEMHTPMNAVIGMGQLLQRSELTDTQRLYVDHIVAGAQDYMLVIDKVLDFSKLESGQLTIDCLPLELRPLLEGIESLISPKAAAKQLALHFTVDAGLPARLLGDEDRLRQCLLILLDNAVKFTPRGSIGVTVSAVFWEGQVPAMRVAVTDTGIGLSDSDRGRLFHPFVQGEGAITRRYDGIGLGLVICQQLIELMAGCFGVDSTFGDGSTFWFELPLRATA